MKAFEPEERTRFKVIRDSRVEYFEEKMNKFLENNKKIYIHDIQSNISIGDYVEYYALITYTDYSLQKF